MTGFGKGISSLEEMLEAKIDGSAILDDLVHDVALHIASGVNNEGVPSQIEFIVKNLGRWEARRSINELLGTAIEKRKPRVLVAEDNKFLRTQLIHTLSTAGFECFSSSNGPDAIEICQVFSRQWPDADFDVIICDYNMPGCNGGEVFESLTDQQKSRFILWSGDGRSGPKEMFRLSKDVSNREMFDAIDRVLEKAKDE